jgi:hypothetical protein
MPAPYFMLRSRVESWGALMTIEIRDPGTEELLEGLRLATGARTLEETVANLLQMQSEQERWVAENRSWIQGKISRGAEQLDRGEGIGEEELDARFAELTNDEG